MREMIEEFGWADQEIDLAWTVAVAERSDAGRVLAGYGGDADGLGPMTFQTALAWRDEHFDDDQGVVQLYEVADRVVAIEPNGWVGKQEETARAVSAGGAAFFSVYWSPVAYRITQATDGEVTGSFEPTLIGMPAAGGDLLPGWVEPEDFPLEHLNSACLAAMARRTGIALDRAWLDLELPAYRIPT